jgi:hypothetical protein
MILPCTLVQPVVGGVVHELCHKSSVLGLGVDQTGPGLVATASPPPMSCS